MQQLTELVFTPCDTGISINQVPQWEEFSVFCHMFCQTFALAKGNIEQGADRSQMHFDFEEHAYILMCEHLSESCWIEGVRSIQSNQSLFDHLTQTIETC